MGVGPSREASSGKLPGALVPPLAGVPRPSPLGKPRKFKITVPERRGPGDTITAMIDGQNIGMVVPPRMFPGMKFEYKIEGEWRKVIGSTLHAVPGTTIVESKPIIWASSSYAYHHSRHNDQKEQITLGKNVGAMLERAQQALLERALAEECNAVLGININITTDSSGEYGNSKLIIASISGTPCVVVSSGFVPGASATAPAESGSYY